MKWGNRPEDEERLARSIASCNKFGYPTHVVECDPKSSLLVKSTMYELTPFDHTIFLDIDTVVLYPLDFIWQLIERGFVTVAYDMGSAIQRWDPRLVDWPEFNTGVIGFPKNESAKKLFDAWYQLCLKSQEVCLNDQPIFTLAALQVGIWPFVLDQRYNFRRYSYPREETVNGPIKIWHNTFPMPDKMPKENGLFIIKAENNESR